MGTPVHCPVFCVLVMPGSSLPLHPCCILVVGCAFSGLGRGSLTHSLTRPCANNCYTYSRCPPKPKSTSSRVHIYLLSSLTPPHPYIHIYCFSPPSIPGTDQHRLRHHQLLSHCPSSSTAPCQPHFVTSLPDSHILFPAPLFPIYKSSAPPVIFLLSCLRS